MEVEGEGAMRFSHGSIYRSMFFRVRPCRDLRACISPPLPVTHCTVGEPRPLNASQSRAVTQTPGI